MNPFTDQWSDQPPVNSGLNSTVTSINQPSQSKPSSTNNQYITDFKNIPMNNVTQSNDQSNDQKSSLPSKIFNEIFSNYEMMICKLFYLLFYSAFGSLFPLIGIYFKQQGMSSAETGILIGSRYIVEIFSARFWFTIAEKFNKGKTILIGSLISWILLTSALAFIRPPAAACISFNGTDFILYSPYLRDAASVDDKNTRTKRWISNKQTEKFEFFKSGLSHLVVAKNKLKDKQKEEINMQKFDQQLPPNHVIGKSPLTVEYAINYNEETYANCISPPFSLIVYRQPEVDEVFILLLLLMLIGEFFAAPTISLVDTITIRQLSNNLNNYSKQRMFGSLGWSMSMLCVGLALDNSTEFASHPCGAHIREKNYAVCFKIFAFLMTIACCVATQFNFDFKDDQIENETNVESNELKTRGDINSNLAQSSQTTNQTINPSNDNSNFLNGKKRKFEFLEKLQSGVFAQKFDRHLEWLSLFQSITNVKLVSLIILAWFFGTGVGLVFTFLFWHLQDIGGTPTLFGIASVINHISEIIAYFYSLQYIKKYGHTRILSLALLCNFVRFLYISYIDNAWLILPFEFVQGITHATVWACLLSCLSHIMPESSKNSTQAILQIVYSGFGKGLGSILSGFLISAYGTRYTFALYAFSSLIAICIFVLIMNVYNRQLAPTVDLGNRTASGRNRQSFLEGDLKNLNNNLNVDQNYTSGFTSFPISPHGVPAPITNRSSVKSCQTPTKTRIDPKINYDDDLDDYITKNHRDWRITMNKDYESKENA